MHKSLLTIWPIYDPCIYIGKKCDDLPCPYQNSDISKPLLLRVFFQLNAILTIFTGKVFNFSTCIYVGWGIYQLLSVFSWLNHLIIWKTNYKQLLFYWSCSFFASQGCYQPFLHLKCPSGGTKFEVSEVWLVGCLNFCLEITNIY